MIPLVLYSHRYGPNPWKKVAIILEELQLPCETTFVEFADVKKEPYVSLNPNGRLPALKDQNKDIIIWESGAIIEYLIEQYDPDCQLSFATFHERNLARVWLHFQATGQGPYYGQAGWFSLSAPENIPIAKERYRNEIRRVTGVLNSVLENQTWLVGDRCSFADLCFIPWQKWAYFFGGDDLDNEFPHVARWMDSMKCRPAVIKVLQEQAEAETRGPKPGEK
ncbi:Bcgst6 [Penicillium herquei]|nr:Bcgst6 [Penicillium herquei]